MLRSGVGAGTTAVIQQARNGRGRPSPWLLALLARKSPKLAAVGLANKISPIAWKLLTTGERYDSAPMLGASGLAPLKISQSAGWPPPLSRSYRPRQMMRAIGPRG